MWYRRISIRSCIGGSHKITPQSITVNCVDSMWFREADARLQQAVILAGHIDKSRDCTGKVGPFGEFPVYRAVGIDPAGTQPIVMKIDCAGGIQDDQPPRPGGGQTTLLKQWACSSLEESPISVVSPER